ncbi:MAG: cell division protein ZapA [Thermodesulfobacteriota bacterium]|nr:cell division protein ZapA [Thermodesulfobacteriota bacterium]
MPSYTLSVLDLEVSFKAKADHGRVQEAKDLLEERYRELNQHGRRLSKEKLLTFLALGLADDLLQNNRKLDELEGKLAGLLVKIDKAGALSTGV